MRHCGIYRRFARTEYFIPLTASGIPRIRFRGNRRIGRRKNRYHEAAERFYINKFYLTRVFKEQFGLSVTSYLTQLRITQAKRLLRFTDKSVENVAQECGLNDANYFSRLFKKVEGTTPGEYRRQW